MAAGFAFTLFLLALSQAGASSANLSHSYHSTTVIPDGSIVNLDDKQTDYVEPANTDNASRLLGVVVAKDDSLLAVDASDSLTQVATSGNANVLVSTLNGSIRVGDKVAVSPINGVGMKSSGGDHIIGLARTAFDTSTSGAVSKDITDKSGNTTRIQVGFVRVAITIGVDTSAGGGPQLSGLQKLARSLTGHTVSTSRVVISLIITVVAFVSLIVLVYASIYGTIISIGRNPLAKYAVFRSLGSVLGMVVLTASIASLTIFLLLH